MWVSIEIHLDFAPNSTDVMCSDTAEFTAVIMARGRAAPSAVVDDDEGASGFEKWNDLQTLALGKAWNKVSMDPASNRTSQKRDPFWEAVGTAYHVCYKELGGIDTTVGKKKRNGKGCKNKWSTMNLQVMRFLSCDIQSSHTLRKSGHGEEDFRKDALVYFFERHRKEFTFERVYDYLKTLPKWLTDTAQHAQAAAKAKKGTLARKKREKLLVSGSDTEGTVDRGLGQKKAKKVKIELSEAEKRLQEVQAKREADIALFREKAVIQLKSIELEKNRARIDEEIEENRIMGLDLTGMDEMRQDYFRQKMRQIVERQAQRHFADVAAEAEEAARAAASEVARNLEDDFVVEEEVVLIEVEVPLEDSPEEFTPEKESFASSVEDMLAFAALCEKMAADAQIQIDIAENGVWPDMAPEEETVVVGTPMPTVVNL